MTRALMTVHAMIFVLWILVIGLYGEEQTGEETINSTGCEVAASAPDCVCASDTFEATVTLTTEHKPKPLTVSLLGRGATFEGGGTTREQICPSEVTYTIDGGGIPGEVHIQVQGITVATVMRVTLTDIVGLRKDKLLAGAKKALSCRSNPARVRPYTWSHDRGGVFDPNGVNTADRTSFTAANEPSPQAGDKLRVRYCTCVLETPLDLVVPCTATTDSNNVNTTIIVPFNTRTVDIINHRVRYHVNHQMGGSIGTREVDWANRGVRVREDVAFTSPIPGIQQFLDGISTSPNWRNMSNDGVALIDDHLNLPRVPLHHLWNAQGRPILAAGAVLMEVANHRWHAAIDQGDHASNISDSVFRVMIESIDDRNARLTLRVKYDINLTAGCAGP